MQRSAHKVPYDDEAGFDELARRDDSVMGLRIG
jgi:hypothetical protein